MNVFLDIWLDVYSRTLLYSSNVWYKSAVSVIDDVSMKDDMVINECGSADGKRTAMETEVLEDK
jgi:hypothetical protein